MELALFFAVVAAVAASIYEAVGLFDEGVQLHILAKVRYYTDRKRWGAVER